MITASSTHEEIFEAIRGTFEELFEIPRDEVAATSTLFEELDLDSLDAADMRAHIGEVTGKIVPEADFQSVRTVQDVVDLVAAVVRAG